MTNNPLISVIVPVYNAQEFLEECFNSLRLQTYENLEFICVNDGSTDNSLEILNKYKELDERFIVLDKENGGASSARNAGLRAVKGDFVSFVDADDRVSLSLYKKFVSLKNKPDVFMFNVCDYDKTTKNIFPRYFFNPVEWKNHKNDNIVHIFDDCINPFHGNMSVCNKIFRTDLLKSLGENPFPEGVIYEDEYFFFLTMLNANSIIINTDPLYYYRRNTSSVSFVSSKRTFDIFKIVDMVEGLLEQKGLLASYKYALFQHKYKIFALEFFKTDEELRDDFYAEMKSRLKRYEHENLDLKVCERLTMFGMYKNILNLESKAFYEKYNGKL